MFECTDENRPKPRSARSKGRVIRTLAISLGLAAPVAIYAMARGIHVPPGQGWHAPMCLLVMLILYVTLGGYYVNCVKNCHGDEECELACQHRFVVGLIILVFLEILCLVNGR